MALDASHDPTTIIGILNNYRHFMAIHMPLKYAQMRGRPPRNSLSQTIFGRFRLPVTITAKGRSPPLSIILNKVEFIPRLFLILYIKGR